LFDTSSDPQKFGQYPREIYAKFRSEAVARLTAAGIRVIDANEYLQSVGSGPDDFIDVVHLSPSGHARIAELLATEIEQVAPQP